MALAIEGLAALFYNPILKLQRISELKNPVLWEAKTPLLRRLTPKAMAFNFYNPLFKSVPNCGSRPCKDLAEYRRTHGETFSWEQFEESYKRAVGYLEKELAFYSL